MPIEIEPVVTPEVVVPSKSYNLMWIKKMTVEANHPDQPVAVTVIFKIYRKNEDGTSEFYTDAVGNEPEYVLSIPNAFTLLQEHPESDYALGLVLDAFQEIRDGVNNQVGVTANALTLIELITQSLGSVAKSQGLFQ